MGCWDQEEPCGFAIRTRRLLRKTGYRHGGSYLECFYRRPVSVFIAEKWIFLKNTFNRINALVMKARSHVSPEFSCYQNALLPLLPFQPSHWLFCCSHTKGRNHDNQIFASYQPQLLQHLKCIFLLLQVSATEQGRWLLLPWRDQPMGRESLEPEF